MITIDDVILKVLVAIYSHDFLNEKMYLKGGQALRLAQNLKSRLSSDSDFSVPEKIKDENHFFNEMEEAIRNEFHKEKFFVIDFKYNKRPKIKEQGVPDFWEGWAVEFKLITKKLLSLSPKEQSAKAIIPKGSSSNKISIDISEMEYCGSFEVIKLKSVNVKVYSKVLLVLEKIRAICQSHPDYALKKNTSNRARDFYDIEQIYNKVLQTNDIEDFYTQCSKHLEKVFNAKDVSLELLDKCTADKDFLNSQHLGWEEVKRTVQNLDQDFFYYVQTLKDIISEIKKR